MTRKLFLALAFAGAAGAFPFAAQALDVDVNIAPPPPRYEAVPPPREGYVWAPGYWNWDGSRYVWANGQYVEEHPGEHWVHHEWREHDGRWRLEGGHWERGDREREEHHRD